MDAAALLSQYGLYAGTALYIFLGGIIPVFNIEAYLLVLASTTDASRHWLPLSTTAAVSAVAAKLLLYAGGRGVGSGVPERHQARVEQVRRRLERWRFGRAGFVFVSALVGFPPFYAVTILAGMLRFGWILFVCASLPACFVRFAAALLFPGFCARVFSYF